MMAQQERKSISDSFFILRDDSFLCGKVTKRNHFTPIVFVPKTFVFLFFLVLPVFLNDALRIAYFAPTFIFCILLMKNLYNCPSEIRSKVSNIQLASEFASFERLPAVLYNLLIIKC
jgi:hypothetical protein